MDRIVGDACSAGSIDTVRCNADFFETWGYIARSYLVDTDVTLPDFFVSIPAIIKRITDYVPDHIVAQICLEEIGELPSITREGPSYVVGDALASAVASPLAERLVAVSSAR